MIAAPRSGSGKTTLTIGLLRALRKAGVRVAAAKCGPDYIDTAFHEAACGRPSVNLDSWAMPSDLIVRLAADASKDSDILVCEASMGLFDGVPAQSGRGGSSADVAAVLDLPVILIMDVSGQSQSAAATLQGFKNYDHRIQIAGVVLNRVASPRHFNLVGDGLSKVGIPIMGSLPRSSGIELPSRHLGLIQAGETSDLETRLEELAAFVTEHVLIDQVIAAAGQFATASVRSRNYALRPPGQRIAIAQDRAFSFMYRHILDDWYNCGAEIKTFSPLEDESPSIDCDVCWLPGGYPELHGGRLASAGKFLAGLRDFAASKPVHGECGGYMALGETMTDAAGDTHAMAGLLGLHTSFEKPKLHLGYRNARLAAPGCLGDKGQSMKGHEFHYARILSTGADEPFAFVSDAYGGDPAPAGSRRGQVTGSFFHIVAQVP